MMMKSMITLSPATAPICTKTRSDPSNQACSCQQPALDKFPIRFVSFALIGGRL